MKRIIALIITATLVISALASCAGWNTQDSNGDGENRDVSINIGVMSGPTGMGMAKLMNDASEDMGYNFTVYSAPTNATADLASGALDMLCLPTNTAASLAAKQPDLLSVISINTLGSLYLLTDADTQISSIADLDGKTILASVPTSTTGPIIEYLLAQNGVNATIEFEADHDALVAKVVSGDAPIVVLPEPKVTAALVKNSAYSVDLNLSTEWEKVSSTPLTMGCLVVRNAFLSENKEAVDAFLVNYKASIEYINTKENLDSSAQMIVDAGVLPQLPVAKKALANLYGSIVYIDGAEMKAALVGFYTAIDMALPTDSFYYEK